ncbi:MAG: hypothetical protein M1840_002034 [Geoglossum simile]|nr:MAG: hypothetical protein M1840_002034 [Geoglossum simile]
MLRKDVTLVKNAIESLTEILTPASGRGLQARSYVAPSQVKTPTQSPTQSVPKNREISVKVNDSNPNSQARAVSREKLMEHINSSIRNSPNENLTRSQTRIRAIKRHPSGDLTLYTESKEHTDYLVRYRKDWQSAIGLNAKVIVL